MPRSPGLDRLPLDGGVRRLSLAFRAVFQKFGHGTNPFGIVPAEQIEPLVLAQVKAALQAPEMIQAVWDEVQKLDATVSEPTVVLAMRNLSVVWNEMFPEERCRLVRPLMAELAPNSIGAELREMEMEAMA